MTFPQTTLTTDDPRLSALAFGELPLEEAADVAAQVAEDPRLQEELAQLQSLGHALRDAFASEVEPSVVTPLDVEMLEWAAQRERLRIQFADPYVRKSSSWPVWLAGTFSAAALIALVALGGGAPEAPPEKVRVYEFLLSDVMPAPARLPKATSFAPLGLGASAVALTDAAGFARVEPGRPVSFALNIGTEAFAALQARLESGMLPLPESVSVEEIINHFRYDYAAPGPGEGAVQAHLEVASAPWSPHHRLLRIGLKARQLTPDATDVNLTDVVAENVGVQVAFNPELVQGYRLLGFNRPVPATPGVAPTGDDLHSGQAVTALYELIPTGQDWLLPESLENRGEHLLAEAGAAVAQSDLVKVTLNYRDAQDRVSRDMAFRLADKGQGFGEASADFRLAAAAAGFGLVLAEAPERGDLDLSQIVRWIESGGNGPDGAPGEELAELVRWAQAAALIGS